MDDSQYNVRMNTVKNPHELKILSVSKIKRHDSCSKQCYFVIRCQNYDNKHYFEYIIDVDGTHICGYHHYNTLMDDTIALKLDYDTEDETIRKKDDKFVPQSYIPGDEDETWIFNTATQFHIKHAEYKS